MPLPPRSALKRDSWSALPSPFRSRKPMIPNGGLLLPGLLMATKTSPLGVTAMCRSRAATPLVTTSLTTTAQNPAGSVMPPLSALHCTLLGPVASSVHDVRAMIIPVASGMDRDTNALRMVWLRCEMRNGAYRPAQKRRNDYTASCTAGLTNAVLATASVTDLRAAGIKLHC